MFKLDLDKAEEPKIKFPASTGSPKKAREFQKYIYYCFFDYAQVFDCVNHNKMQKILQFSHSVGSDSLWPHELQHARLPCPTGSCPPPTPGVYPNSSPLNRICHLAIWSSVIPFSSCPQSLSAWVFSNESTLHMRWPQYWIFSFRISPSNEHPGPISFRKNTLKQMEIPDPLTCLLRNLYAGQEATVLTGHGIMDWFWIRKGVCQGCILSPYLFNIYAEYIMR